MEPESLPTPETINPMQVSAPPPPASTLHRIFVGPHGIRAGWRFFLFFVLLFAFSSAVGVIIKFLTHGTARGLTTLTPPQISLSEGIGFAITCAATLIMMRIERGRWKNYGLTLRNILGRHFWEGALGGFASVSLVLLVIFLLHGFRITGVATHGMTLVWSTLAWCFAMLVVGLSEEFAFRGYAQYSLSQGIGFWPAACVLSALFGLSHIGNNGETMWGLLSVVCFGLLFCLFLRRTGNLWWAIGFHAGWDWAQTFFYGVPDSGLLASHNFLSSAFHGPVWLTGGSVGPEASLFTPLALGLAGLLFARRFREVKYRPQAASARLTPPVVIPGEAGGVVA